jgi:NAD(P)-dependent dehydrogenase (short-subunit alcohol dehydrogenase family)
MSSLQSLTDGYRAWVFGASGGIGAAFVQVLQADPRCAHVYAGSRTDLSADRGAHEKVTPFSFSLDDESSIQRAVKVAAAAGAPDLVLVTTGLLHAPDMQPEKTMRALDADRLARSFAVNAIGPALIAKHALPLLPRDRKSVFAALSARVSSISDNRSGGWHAYRAAKAALNMLIRNCAIELAARNTAAICVGLHPGTVDTAMSAPFKSGVAPEKLFSPHQSVTHLLAVIDQLTPAQSGSLIAWDGQPIAF